jgi:hypothetical protein
MTQVNLIQDDELIAIAGGTDVRIRIGDGDGNGGNSRRDGIVPDVPDRTAGGGGTGTQYDNPDGGTENESEGFGG